VISRHLSANSLLSYSEQKLLVVKQGDHKSVGIVERLQREAEAALKRGPYAVTDKTTVAPSGDPHDYWHLAPYWWPNPATPDGLPYVHRDGERVLGAGLYDPGSEQYDRTRLQCLFQDTTMLALAWKLTGDPRYAEHGTMLIRHWFLDPKTRMNPHLRYAQVRRGHNCDLGQPQGIIELKDFYFFLDGVRLLEESGDFKEPDRSAFQAWLRTYLEWLVDSDQGQRERVAVNNHGTFYDLQVASLAAYLGERDLLATTFQRASQRLFVQFDVDGRQPHELERPDAQHYCSFNLQGWVSLAELARKCGMDLWEETDTNRSKLKLALQWFLSYEEDWPISQRQAFEPARLWPLSYAYLDCYGALPRLRNLPERYACEPVLHPYYAIKPFWMLN